VDDRIEQLSQSKAAFLERCRECGEKYAEQWLAESTDYGELTKVATGYPVIDLPDSISDLFEQEKFVFELGGFVDIDAFMEGLNRTLQNMRDQVSELLNKIR